MSILVEQKDPGLTPGEKLRILRRRKGWSQEAAAQHYEVHSEHYRRWETGVLQKGCPRFPMDAKPHEVCFILRLRSRKFQRELAASLGVTRLWIHKMEVGEVPCERLMDYWKVSDDQA
jgi:DNA-binding XRE family transcriptional regulator